MTKWKTYKNGNENKVITLVPLHLTRYNTGVSCFFVSETSDLNVQNYFVKDYKWQQSLRK